MNKSKGYLMIVVGAILAVSFAIGGFGLYSGGDSAGLAFCIPAILGVVLVVKGREKVKESYSSGTAKNTTSATNTSSAPRQMVCPECGKKYPLDQVYCEACGALLKAK